MKLQREDQPATIGIFRALNLGDMLCIIPTVRAVRAAYPASHISLIGLPWGKDFVKRFSHYFDTFIEFPGWPGLPEQEADPERILTFLKDIRKKKFDLVFQMQGNGEITNTMCMLWGARQVCGLKKPNEFGAPDRFPVSDDNEHEIIRFLKLLDILNIPQKGFGLEFPLTEEELTEAAGMIEKVIPQGSKYVCLHPGARDERRRWPSENFAFIGNRLVENGYSIVLTGSEQEGSLLQELEEQIKYPVVNIVREFGQVQLGLLAAFLKYSNLLVSNDTGVSHIAAALEIPSVIIFSPYSNINRWAPLNASVHLAIPFDKAKDVQHVLRVVLSRLAENRTAHQTPRDRFRRVPI